MFYLSKFKNTSYKPGNLLIRSAWYLVSILFFETKLPYPRLMKIFLLKLFKCKLGSKVIIKPSVKIKYPWQLTLGSNVWIGEKVWIDNVAEVSIGSNVCISQKVMMESGNHDFKSESFDLLLQPININDNVWIGCDCLILPGTNIQSGSVYFGGKTINDKTAPDKII